MELVCTKSLRSIDIVGENNKQTKITHADTELAINLPIQKVISALYHLSRRIFRRLILKPRTDLYVFIFGEREFQTDGPEKAKLVW